MIELENHSAFPAMVYEKLGYKNCVFDVLAIKGTFRLKTDGTRADLAQEQAPLVSADVYWGDDPERNSLRYETDLILGKLHTDVHVVGHAYSTDADLQSSWDTWLTVGEINKKLRVHGPREWYFDSEGWRTIWRMGKAQAVDKVPLRYELAYGGQYMPREGTAPLVYEKNPLGRGFYHAKLLDKKKRYPAAQIEVIQDKPKYDIDDRLAPEGYGPLSRWWTERAQHAGTYDAAWKQNTWPYYPSDFNAAFFNSAPLNQQSKGFLQGNEHVVLRGFLPECEIVETALGAYQPICVLEDGRAELHRFMPRLETVTIDTDSREIHHTWRLTLPRSMGVRHIVLGALTPPRERGPMAKIHTIPVREIQMPRNIEKENLDRLSWLLGKEDF